MGLIDSASLVVTPNSYKATKLYSIIPDNGSGDMTFARTGNTATRVNSSGLIEPINANIPRLDYLGGGCPKLLLEPQRTNVILQSQDISNASWVKTNSPTIVSNVAVAPDGTTTSDSIQDETGGSYKSIKQAISVSANSTYTFSFFVKKETSRTNYCGVGIDFSGGTNKFAFAVFDETNGTLINLSISSITPVFKTETFGNYYRFSITVTDNGSNNTLTASIYANLSVNGTSLGVGAGSARTIWGAQLEAGAYATSYIPTTTASVTRNVDSCSKSSVTALIGQTEGTIFMHSVINNSDSESGQRFIALNDGTVNNRIAISRSGNTFNILIMSSGTTQWSILTSEPFIGNCKFALAYKGNDAIFYVNGVQITSTNTLTVPACNAVLIGISEVSGSHLGVHKINSAALWKTRLSNQELATLTTL